MQNNQQQEFLQTMDKLAIHGGSAVRTAPWQAWPHFAEDEISAVSDVLRSGKVNYWTGETHTLADGTMVRGENGLFEYEFSCFIGMKYAVTLANGTLALELALHTLGIGNGDKVIVTSRTFIASASACVMRGAIPVFADVDPESQNISMDSIRKLYTPDCKAIICVHLAGWACDMDPVMEFAAEHDMKVIEDCAQCVGGKYKDRMLGSIGHAAAFSFCQDKIMSTGGEGGMLLTNDPEAYKRAWTYKDHGKDFSMYNNSLKHPLAAADNDKATAYSSLGSNWRMTEMQAAIGRKQLAKLTGWIATRRAHAQQLDAGLGGINGLKVVTPPSEIFHAYYKYYAFLELNKLAPNWTRELVIDAICAEGVVCQFGSAWGIGLENGWKDFHCTISGRSYDLQLKENLPYDFMLGTTSLMFQVHPTLDKQAIADTVAAVRKVMRVATTK